MKNVISFIIIALFIVQTGCSKSDEQTDLHAKTKYSFEKAGTEIMLDPLINGGENLDAAAILQLDEARRNAVTKLDNLDPIAENEKNARSGNDEIIKRTALYKKFLIENKTDTVLIRQFRSRYAKKLLVDYDFINSSDPEMLEFFIRELIAAKTGQFEVIMAGLNNLKTITGKSITPSLQETVRKQIDLGIALQKIIMVRQEQMLQKLKKGEIKAEGALRPDFMEAVLQVDNFPKMIAELEEYRDQLANL